jgi:hypothetical protein
MRIVPKVPNHLGTGLKKILDILGEGIGFFTLDIDGPKDTLSRLVEDRNNDHREGIPDGELYVCVRRMKWI